MTLHETREVQRLSKTYRRGDQESKHCATSLCDRRQQFISVRGCVRVRRDDAAADARQVDRPTSGQILLDERP